MPTISRNASFACRTDLDAPMQIGDIRHLKIKEVQKILEAPLRSPKYGPITRQSTVRRQNIETLSELEKSFSECSPTRRNSKGTLRSTRSQRARPKISSTLSMHYPHMPERNEKIVLSRYSSLTPKPLDLESMEKDTSQRPTQPNKKLVRKSSSFKSFLGCFTAS